MKPICQTCIFKERKKIPYSGKIPCDIMIIGEAPGATEELLGKPFVGDTGKILRTAIVRTGLDKYRILIANALRCRIFKDKDKTKDINSAMKNCKTILEEAINKAKPKLLVCLGSYAIKQIIGQTEVMANRGRIYETKYGIPAFMTVHPSYILRKCSKGYPNIPYEKMSATERIIFDDLKIVKDMADNGFKPIDYRGEYVEATLQDLKNLLNEKRIAVDLETDGLGYGNNRKILSISFTPKAGKSYVVTKLNKPKLNVINKILKSDKIIKIVANRPFDEIMWYKKYNVKWKGIIHDVLVLAHLLDENLDGGYNLENVAHTYTDLKNIKDEAQGLRKEIAKMDEETLIRYNGIDTDATYRSYIEIINRLKKDKKLINYYKNFILPVLNMYGDITGIGFEIDKDEVDKAEKELKELSEKLHSQAISKIHGAIRLLHKDKGLKLSRAELIRDVLFMSKFGYRLKPKKFTGKTKVPATDEGHLKEFKGNPFVDLLLEWKKVHKLLTTYIPQIRGAINEDGKIYPNTLFINTVTGRTVVLNPTIQTIPQRSEYAKYIKRIFKGPKGYLLCARDLAQSELRIIGWLAKDKNILDALKKGIDLHTKTAAIVNKCKIEEVTKDIRQKAKCFHPDTEVLTKNGWVKFRDYDGETEIAEAVILGEMIFIKWVKPLFFELRKNHCDKLVWLKNEGMDLRITPDHRCLIQRATGKFEVVTPYELPKARRWWNTGIDVINPDGILDIDERLIRIIVAVQADGNLVVCKNGEITRIRFGFRKERKKERLLKLLRENEYKITEKNGVNTIVINSKNLIKNILRFLNVNKEFSWELLNLPRDKRIIFLDELKYWDGLHAKPPKMKMDRYYSTNKRNIDFIQAMASISGFKTRVVKNIPKKEQHKTIYSISIKKHPYSRGENLPLKEIEYKDDIAVLTVESSFVLVRDGGIPVITGQCFNFGFVYGMSAKSFVDYAREEYGQIFSQEEAEEIRRSFFAKPNGYYNLPLYHRKMIEMARKYGYVRSPLGRKRRLPNINSQDNYLRAEAERQAINFPVQSFSSDLALIGKMLFYKWIKEEKLIDKIIPLWFIHDAVMFLAKEGIEEEAHRKLKQIYLEETPRYIKNKFGIEVTYPVESDGKIGHSWAEMEELGW